jgi:hypothetical protein
MRFSRKIFTVLWSVFLLTGWVFAQSPTMKWDGFLQTTFIKAENQYSGVFGLERLRLFARGEVSPFVAYQLHLDMLINYKEKASDGDTPGTIRDAVIFLKPNEKYVVSVGKFKTPLGMEFANSGNKLDFIKRGLGYAMVFEWNAGIMLSGNKVAPGGLGFDLGVFNPGPKEATDTGNLQDGYDYTFAGRLKADPGKNLHAQVYAGYVSNSVGDTTKSMENILAFGGGVKFTLEQFQLKAEYFYRDDPDHPKVDGTNFYVDGLYRFMPNYQAVLRIDQLDVTGFDKVRTDIIPGLNIFFNAEAIYQTQFKINYVISNMADMDALQCMFQVCF